MSRFFNIVIATGSCGTIGLLMLLKNNQKTQRERENNLILSRFFQRAGQPDGIVPGPSIPRPPHVSGRGCSPGPN